MLVAILNQGARAHGICLHRTNFGNFAVRPGTGFRQSARFSIRSGLAGNRDVHNLAEKSRVEGVIHTVYPRTGPLTPGPRGRFGPFD